jgi:hypothetical protein
MHDAANAADAIGVGTVMNPALAEAFIAPAITYDVECVGPDGEVKWTERVHNVVCTAGKTDIVDKYLKGSSYTAAWYCILAGAGTKAAGDTLASHAGWTESTPYAGNRPSITWGTTSSGSNTSTAVSISINATATVAGAGICTVNSGTSGTLYSVSDFSASRSVASGDTLNVTFTISVS